MKKAVSFVILALLAVACGAQAPVSESIDSTSQDIVVHGPYECKQNGVPYTDANNPILNGPAWCFSSQEVGYTAPGSTTFVPYLGPIQRYTGSLSQCGYISYGNLCYSTINCSTNNTQTLDPNVYVTDTFTWLPSSGLWQDIQFISNVATHQTSRLYLDIIFFPGAC